MKRKNATMIPVLMFSLCLAMGWMGTSSVSEAAGESDTWQVLSNLQLAGGISGGWFYASSPGEDTSESEFLLSNLLVELSYEDEALPMGFVAAFGETSTPSVLDAPENNKTLAFEYAGVMLSPAENLTLEVGLLGPNSGYEETYTYANSHILLGAVASQQPYNAYGVKFGYEAGGLAFWGGYYGDRLDEEEYDSPVDAWEMGVEFEFAGTGFGLYHYHVGGYRYLTGMVAERTIGAVDLGFNIDYWSWGNRMDTPYDSDSAIGGAVYVCPNFGDFSLPLRFEYIQQDESEIYIENAGTVCIFSAVITPTWHFSENTYARAEASWVVADGGFEDENGGSEDSNMGMAIEFGVAF